ncbi:MAG: YigZ family protein [Phycisphaerae bacterium]|nr:YigZ family protein [Phycisphaerae bacterium]
MTRYRIPQCRTTVETRVSNSRFIATAASVSTVKAAQDFIRAVRAELPDATHHVYAYKIGFGGSVSEGMSDDGEPSGTSGPPTLAVLRGAEIGDVVLVTTRYFGGTKLGTGGLVAAYTAAAQAVLAALPTEEKVTRVRLQCVLPYTLHEQARRLFSKYEGRIEDEQYGADVTVRLLVPEEHIESLTQRLADLSAGRVVPMRIE